MADDNPNTPSPLSGWGAMGWMALPPAVRAAISMGKGAVKLGMRAKGLGIASLPSLLGGGVGADDFTLNPDGTVKYKDPAQQAAADQANARVAAAQKAIPGVLNGIMAPAFAGAAAAPAPAAATSAAPAAPAPAAPPPAPSPTVADWGAGPGSYADPTGLGIPMPRARPAGLGMQPPLSLAPPAAPSGNQGTPGGTDPFYGVPQQQGQNVVQKFLSALSNPTSGGVLNWGNFNNWQPPTPNV